MKSDDLIFKFLFLIRKKAVKSKNVRTLIQCILVPRVDNYGHERMNRYISEFENV